MNKSTLDFNLKFHEDLSKQYPALLKKIEGLRDGASSIDLKLLSEGVRNKFVDTQQDLKTFFSGIVNSEYPTTESAMEKSLAKLEEAISERTAAIRQTYETLSGETADMSIGKASMTWDRDRVEEQITGKTATDSPISPRLDDARTLYQNITQWQDRHEPKEGERADGQYKDMETLRAGVFDFIREMDNTLSGAEAGMTKEQSAYWRWLNMDGSYTGGTTLATARQTVDIATDVVADTDTTISVGEVYNRLELTCDVESIENLIESPLDDDLLKSPYSNKQKYMTEYSSDGEGSSAIDAFDAMIHGNETTYEAGRITDWYIQVMDNAQWVFPDRDGSLVEKYCSEGTNQQDLPNVLPTQQAACIVALGKVEKKTDGKDNSPTSKVDMTNYLAVSVNGNGKDGEATAYPNATSLKEGIPSAVYNGGVSGGVFSPTDDDTTNYIVLSGSLTLNPLMEMTDNYKALYDYEPSPGAGSWTGWAGIRKWWHCTVPSRDNGDGRYYTQQWWKADTPGTTPTWDRLRTAGLVPYTEKGPELYEFQYSAIGDGSDHISKVAVLACMLIIGDKCVVETGTDGQPGDFEWRTYKNIEECSSEDEYYQQSFTIGFDPKIGDKLIGTKFDFQNNISYELGIDADGIAIPIKRSDKVSGRVTFKILGPVNTLWDVVTRRHPTWFRHTKWNSTSVPLLAHVSNIFLEKFEVKVYSDNGLVNNTGDNDLIYVSDTKETFVNVKDDLEMKINSALTTAECQALGVTDSVKMSTPTNTQTGEGVLTIYDYGRGESGKAEQQYVDSYYNEYHAPRVQMTQKLMDEDGGIVSLFAHYRHPTIGKTFFVQGISRNMEEGYAEMTLKEIDQ